MITADILQCAMESGIGPLDDDFETPELKRIHDLWIEGHEKIRDAEDALRRLLPVVEACDCTTASDWHVVFPIEGEP
jgi:hypothetical protein